jgi:hypothetical protein
MARGSLPPGGDPANAQTPFAATGGGEFEDVIPLVTYLPAA